MKRSSRLYIVCIVILLSLSSLFGQSASDLIFADEPIFYGDENFRARILAQTQGERSPIGLVLSGGSARAFAHIGMLEYLEEVGIVPDFIVSNSMGSIVGMFYAAGFSPKQIRQVVSTTSVQTLFDMTLPIRGGLLDPARFLSYVSTVLGGSLELSELPIPIIVVTEDLVTERQVVISEGDFLTVLQASFALPVYFEPVEFNGHLLIDGGVTNLAPVDLAYDYSDSVIVSTTFYDVDTLNLRNPLVVLNVALDIGKRRQGVIELKEHYEKTIWIRNAVEDISFMEFGRVSYLAQKGYESALEQEEALSSLASATGDCSHLASYRSDHQLFIDAARRQYRYFEQTPMIETNHIVGPAFTQYTNRRLSEEVTLGLSYAMGVKSFHLRTNLGSTMSIASNDGTVPVPTFSTEFEYYPWSFLRTAVNGTIGYQWNEQASFFAFSSAVEGRLFVWDEQVRLNFLLSYEHLGVVHSTYRHQGWRGGHSLFYFSTIGTVDMEQGSAPWLLLPSRLELSYQLLSGDGAHRSFLYFDTASGTAHRPSGIYGELEFWGRFGIDGKGDVPLLPTDSYRTADLLLRRQGRDLSISTNPDPFLIGLNFTFGWRPLDANVSVAEMLLFKENSIGLYTNLLFSKQKAAPNASLGVEIHTEISLLGIHSLPTTFFLGWDEASNGIVWGFLLTLGL